MILNQCSPIPWTRLTEDPLFKAAEKIHKSRRSSYYHSWDHVVRLYTHTEHLLRLPYCRALDIAICTHSLFFTSGHTRTQDAIDWLKEELDPCDPDLEVACQLIRSVKAYLATYDMRLILVCLSDFADKKQHSDLFEKIKREACGFNSLSEKEFRDQFPLYLDRVLALLRMSKIRCDKYVTHCVYRAILDGLENLRNFASTTPNK